MGVSHHSDPLFGVLVRVQGVGGVFTGVRGWVLRASYLQLEGRWTPPMWGTVLILVPYPTTSVINVSANFTSIKSYMPANIGPPAGVGVMKTYGAKGRENLWR